jgi:hydroxymethylglutaryl-CoA reductase (NADPH)
VHRDAGRGLNGRSDLLRGWPRKNTPEAQAERAQRVREAAGLGDEHDEAFAVDLERFGAAQEMLTGVAVIPVGVVGPVLVELGSYEREEPSGAPVETGRALEELYIPLAHTEGGLTASLFRGAYAVAQDGGVHTYVLADGMTRDSCLEFASSGEAVAAARFVEASVDAMRAWLAGSDLDFLSRHAVLRGVETHVVGPWCHVLYRFTTGDACGPNMMTRNAHALNHGFLAERLPADAGVTPLRIALEANMGGDKKPSHRYFERGGHGKTVLAEATLSARTLRRVLRTTAEDVLALERMGAHGSLASGMQSSAFTPASAVAALFAATGQDLGMVGTSSMAHGAITPSGEGGVQVSLRLAGVEVGVLGGGTTLPFARTWLESLGCRIPGGSFRLAQIVAAAALCLDVSAVASMASAGSANFVEAHHTRGGLR